MRRKEFDASRRFVATSRGRVAYMEKGEGPAAVFLHAFALNGFQWRDVIPGLASYARCVAVDLLGMGNSELADGVNPTLPEQARMLVEVADALALGPLHLVGNDTGGGVAQVFAVDHPDRVQSLCLINSEAHDNFPPEGLKPIIEAAARGELGEMFGALAGDVALARSAMGSAIYGRPEETLTQEVAAAYLEPLVRDSKAIAAFTRFVLEIDSGHLVSIKDQLQQLDRPALILWGEEDRVLPLKWGEWLCRTLPRANLILVPGGGLCWPEEQPDVLVGHLRAFWASTQE